MKIEVSRCELNEIVSLRDLHRQAMNCQIVHDSYSRRGFSDPYLIRVDGRIAGYGLVANQHYPDTVNEFYTIPAYRAATLPMFRRIALFCRTCAALSRAAVAFLRNLPATARRWAVEWAEVLTFPIRVLLRPRALGAACYLHDQCESPVTCLGHPPRLCI